MRPGISGLTRWIGAPAAILLAFLTGEKARAQTPFVIQGQVVDTLGAPIADIEASILETGATARTSATGTFRLSVPRAGNYSLRIRAIGYRPRILQVSVEQSLVTLKPLILRQVSVILPELSVEGKLPIPLLNLRPAMLITRSFIGGGLYWHFDPHGAALSPNALAVIRLGTTVETGLNFFSWYENLSRTWGAFAIGAAYCPRPANVTLATAWIGFSDTLLYLNVEGSVWAQRRNHGIVGPCVQQPPLRLKAPILNAGPMLGGWLVLDADSLGQFRVVHHSADGQPRWEVAAPSFIRSKEDAAAAYITVTTLGATVSSAHWPFEWVELNASGEARVRTIPVPHPTKEDSVRYARWTAYPVLPIVNGFVQTLVDAGAAHRVIVLYDLLGRPLSITQVAGAPGLVASDLARRKLLGIRFSAAGRNRGELIEYDY